MLPKSPLPDAAFPAPLPRRHPAASIYYASGPVTPPTHRCETAPAPAPHARPRGGTRYASPTAHSSGQED
jgi:hypothetical protein